jgi:hypothetical protein
MIHKQENKTAYYIEKYSIQEHEYDKDITLNSGTINLSLSSVEDALQVAKLAHITDFVILESSEDDSRGDRNKRVAIRGRVEEWEARVGKQDIRDEDNKQATIKELNELPDKVILFRNKDFYITASKSQTSASSYRWSDVKYRISIMYKKEELGGHWHTYINDAHQILKKKFAKDIYSELHRKELSKMNYDAEKRALNDIAPEFITEQGKILETAVKKLNDHNAQIEHIKHKQRG